MSIGRPLSASSADEIVGLGLQLTDADRAHRLLIVWACGLHAYSRNTSCEDAYVKMVPLGRWGRVATSRSDARLTSDEGRCQLEALMEHEAVILARVVAAVPAEWSTSASSIAQSAWTSAQNTSS